MELMDKEFQELVSLAALANLSERKFNKVKTLPTSGDLKKLSDWKSRQIQNILHVKMTCAYGQEQLPMYTLYNM